MKSKFASLHNWMMAAILVAGPLTTAPAKADLNLYAMSPKAQTIDGTIFPRNHLTLYRGINAAQADYGRAVKAMLGDRLANIETPIFFTVKQVLMGKPATLLSTFSDIATEYHGLNLQPLVDRETRIHGENMSEAKAVESTKKILSQAYSQNWARTHAIDYTSSERIDFPRAFSYSTVYVEVAKIYSPHIIIYDESDNKRSLDVNYWNKVNNGHWVHTNLSYPDRGEFLTPFIIPYNQVTGYQFKRTNFDTNFRLWRALSADLGVVFMKHVLQGKEYVYVFDAEGMSHVVQGSAGFCGATSRFNPNDEIPELAKMDCLQRPKLIAVLRACTDSEVDDDTCKTPASLFSPYKMTDDDYDSFLQGMNGRPLTNGKKIYSFTSPDSTAAAARTKTNKNRSGQ